MKIAAPLVIVAMLIVVSSHAGALAAAPTDAAGVEFFEKRIRPVLTQHCYDCHNSIDKAKGGLALDYRDALLKGGESGDVIVPGRPNESVLIWAIRHEQDYKMPSKAPKLSDAVIADFEKWVEMGAPDPRTPKPTKQDLEQKLPWPQVRAERAKWWAYQPLLDHTPPQVDDPAWRGSAIDRFVYDRMRGAGLSPQPEASPHVLARRVHLILTGLPPSPRDVEAFVNNPTTEAYERMVDRLLGSHAFGEKWARHWMDWYRYAETHGSEGDPPIPHAEQYRHYLIRALNDDVRYDQLLREHLAGDLLDEPRLNRELGINESKIGPAHLRMVPHGFGVTDAYQEQITFTDNQIDVISKAMLGVTVSCARCHDHKFDPISQRDFYKFYGVMISTRPSTVLVDTPQKLETNKAEMAALKKDIRAALAAHWLTEIDTLPQRLDAAAKKLAKRGQATDPLGLWVRLRDSEPQQYAAHIERHAVELKKIKDANAEAIASAEFYVDLRDQRNADRWFTSGNGTAVTVSPAGSFAVQPEGGEAIRGIYPAGIYSHLLSDKHAAVLSTDNFTARGGQTMMRVAGHDAEMRVPIRNYPLTHGGLHPADNVKNATLGWQRTGRKWQYWRGERVHYELRTSKDIIPRPGKSDRSWWGVTQIIAGDQPMRDAGASLLDLVDDRVAIVDRASLDAAYQTALRSAVSRWGDGGMSDKEAEFLDAFVRLGLLSNDVKRLPEPIGAMVERYRQLEADVPVPTRAPGVIDAGPVDQPLLVRGEYKQEAEPVERGFLEVYGDEPFDSRGSGRLELAEAIVGPANTLKSRLLVNRLWAYVFGRGIVASTDNFGRLGDQPTHPQLLDHLALSFERDGWSIKRALKRMVMSRAFRSSSCDATQTQQIDPDNALLSHYTPRRLDAEAIMDSINLLAGVSKRAVHTDVVRNRLDPFLQTFNAPIPTTTVSRRNHVDVPAQALTMMNGSLVERAARTWSQRIAGDASLPTPREKIAAMVTQAYGRPATEAELKTLLAYLTGEPDDAEAIRKLAGEHDRARQALAAAERAREELVAPVMRRLQAEVDQRNAESTKQRETKPVDLKPIARWDFDADARDALGAMHGTLRGNAKIENGALVLDGGCVLTEPLDHPLGARTLEVLVQLDTLDQRGGGAMTVQTPGGAEFDSIVYAEKSPRQWLAGSDHFRRTESFEGEAEAEADARPVRITIVYDADGAIRAYRDGKPYGEPYRKTSLRRYERGEAQVTFGLRHGGGPVRGRMLTGRVHEAKLYDRALTAAEVAASASGAVKEVVTRAMLLEALSPEQRERLDRHDVDVRELEQAAAEAARRLSTYQDRRRDRNDYYGIAHALINSKEFIYVY